MSKISLKERFIYLIWFLEIIDLVLILELKLAYEIKSLSLGILDSFGLALILKNL
jgi:hypothetical protein